MPLVKINTPVHYHVKKYRICKNKILCQGPVSCFDGNMVVSAGMAHISDPSDSYSESVLPRPFLQGAAPCQFLVTPCPFKKLK